MPDEGITLLHHDDILTFEEITAVIQEAVKLGIDKIRLTGGEPLVRKGIVELVQQIAAPGHIKDLALTTNGILLEEMALPLKKAGLHRVNVSLDTTDPSRYQEITRGGDISKVFRGIQAAREAGLNPVKINCVILASSDEKSAREVKAFCRENDLSVRFIRQMDLETGEFSVVEGGSGGNCSVCNRLRLTANGMVKPCLFDEYEFSVRKLGARAALLSAVNYKPLNGCINRTGSFYSIGG
jgi:cyclic pyranopterin phosphate synthase